MRVLDIDPPLPVPNTNEQHRTALCLEALRVAKVLREERGPDPQVPRSREAADYIAQLLENLVRTPPSPVAATEQRADDLRADSPAKQFPHYYKDVYHLEHVDIYRILRLFDVTDPCLQHAAKKVLTAGRRGMKADMGMTAALDVGEAIATLKRYLELNQEDQSR
jgi:hypothetical protein